MINKHNNAFCASLFAPHLLHLILIRAYFCLFRLSARNATIAKDTACAGSCRKVLHGSVKYTFLLPLPHYLSLTTSPSL